MGKDHGDGNPELLVDEDFIKKENLFVSTGEKGEVLLEYAFSFVYWGVLNLPLGSHYVHVYSESRTERGRRGKMAFSL